MSQGSMGSFSSQGIRPSNTVSYYLASDPVAPPAPSTAIVAPPSNPEGVFYNAQNPYYSFYTGISVPPSPSPPSNPPFPNVVPNPGDNSTNSKAFAVNKLGGASVPISASSNFAIDGPIQYQNSPTLGISYFVGTAGNPPPAPPPLAPEVIGITATTATAYFSVAGITGIGTLQYSVRVGTSNPPSQGVSFPAVRASPTLSIYVASLTGLTANTTYYIESIVSDVGGSTVSPSPNQFITLPSGGSAPTGTIGVPAVVGTPTSSSITVSVDATGVNPPPPEISILYGTTNINPAVPAAPTSYASGIYTFVITGLNPSTQYFFQSVASTGVAPNLVSTVSAGVQTAPVAPIPNLTTNIVIPFLIQGPRFGQAYTAALDYYVNVGAVGCTLAVGASAIAGNQLYGSLYGGSIFVEGQTTNAGVAQTDQPYSVTAGAKTDAYFESVGTDQTRRLISWGGFYADILGLFGPYQPAGIPAPGNPTAVNVVDSICNIFLGISGSPNPLTWASTGWSTVFDGIVLDFENVGLGGRPSANQFPLPQNPAPSFPANANDPLYQPYIAALGSIPAEFFAQAPAKYLANAPVSLSINGDLLTGKNHGNIGASNTALNTWFAFANSNTIPSALTYNNQASSALNHPSVMCFFDDIFVQFYNENAEYYPGGDFFPNLLAQWGYVAILAQLKGNKKTRINIGLARGNIIPGGSPAVASAQGPTPPLDSELAPPYEYWYPQYCTSSPPNAETGQTQNWPDTSIQKDPINISNAITHANSVLQQSFANPNLKPSDWLSGMGFWAGSNATIMAKDVYNATSIFTPGNVLPAIETYCWSDASYPAPNPEWPGNVPVTSTLVPQ